MRHPRIIIASISLAAAAAIGGGATVAIAANSSASSPPTASQHATTVAYNGHLLYTFAGDQVGQVTGQGLQGFLVATPGLPPLAGSSAGTVPSDPPGSNYGY